MRAGLAETLFVGIDVLLLNSVSKRRAIEGKIQERLRKGVDIIHWIHFCHEAGNLIKEKLKVRGKYLDRDSPDGFLDIKFTYDCENMLTTRVSGLIFSVGRIRISDEVKSSISLLLFLVSMNLQPRTISLGS